MSKYHKKKQVVVEDLVFQPRSSQSIQQGINLIVDTIRPTLGPIPRMVAVSQALDNKPPELLDKGGVIARRIFELPDRDADMGAMFVRQMLWQLYEEVGDGTATAAVLFQSIYNAGRRYIVSGGNAMRLRHFLQLGLQLINKELDQLSQPIEGQMQLAQLAESICYDPPLASELGEIFEFIGEYGQLDVRRGHKRGIEHEYLKGMYWNQGAVSRQMLAGGKETDRIVMNDAAILLSDLEIEDPLTVVPIVDVLMQAGAKSLLIVASKFSEAVINLILANKDPKKFRIIAVKTPGMTPQEQIDHLKDISVLTGATPLYKAAGDTLVSMKTAYLGQAKQLWVERSMFGVVGERESDEALTEHMADLMMLLEAAKDKDEQETLRTRIGKLLGGVAILRIGVTTPAEMDARIGTAKDTAKSIRRAIRDGIVPGGGIALLHCQTALSCALTQTTNTDERAAYQILIDALEEPARSICDNAGYDSSMFAEIQLAGPGQGLDARTGEIADMLDAGIFDVASVVKSAIRSAVTSAGLALTIDVLVHHKTPQTTYTP